MSRRPTRRRTSSLAGTRRSKSSQIRSLIRPDSSSMASSAATTLLPSVGSPASRASVAPARASLTSANRRVTSASSRPEPSSIGMLTGLAAGRRFAVELVSKSSPLVHQSFISIPP